MLCATGDTHMKFHRFSTKVFPEQKEMTRDDFILICGDFGGIWYPAEPFPLISERDRQKALKNERYNFAWLESKNPTFCYVLGNHENYNRYDSGEFPVVDFHGGKAHQMAENVFHLMSGYVFVLNGKTIYTFDGAGSHDISDGILDREKFESDEAFVAAYKKKRKESYLFRVRDFSWWERETLPTHDEIVRGWKNLEAHGNKVDFIMTHCLPQSVVSAIDDSFAKPDNVTRYLNAINETVNFGDWICGHYHVNRTFFGKYHVLYEQIVRIA